MCDLKECVIHSTGFGINNKGYISENNNLPVVNLHGTIVAMIIRHLCSEIEFISVNILNEDLSTDGRILLYSLNQILDFKPDIIHLSLGTIKKRYIFPLKKVVRKAVKLNIPLVVAAENSGKISYPAYLKDVIGVKAETFENCIEYSYNRGFFYAPIGTYGIDYNQEIPSIRDARGTSISAAYISGHLAVILSNNRNLTIKEAKKALIEGI